MPKNSRFDKWNKRKKRIDSLRGRPYFSAGEIWWASLGQNISSEITGKGMDFLRPVLVFKVVYGDALLAIPLTSQKRIGNYYFSFVDSKGNAQCALLAQIRYLDAKRLKYKRSSIRIGDFKELVLSFVDFVKK